MNREPRDSHVTAATLRDGAPVLLRGVRPDDAPLFQAAFERLGQRSRYRRFLSYRGDLTKRELRFFTHVDHRDHEAVAALDGLTGAGLGVARYVRDESQPDTAEAAVAVVDEWQGRGLGTLLLETLVERARDEGVDHFTASLLTENEAMLELFKRIGTVDLRRVDHDVMQIDVHLAVGDRDPLASALRAAACGEVAFVSRDDG